MGWLKRILGALTDFLNVGRKWKLWKKDEDPFRRK